MIAIKRTKMRQGLRPYLMVAPAMIGLAFFTLYPLFEVIRLSFFNVNMLNPSKTAYVGLKNYFQIFARADFQRSLINTFIYTFYVVIIISIISLLIAMWIKKSTKINKVVLAFSFAPHVVSIVSVSIIFSWMMNPEFGLFNYILKSLGLPTSKWLTGSTSALPSVIFVSAWKAIGYDVLIYTAALKNIPQELYEAANLDNAKPFTVFRKITFPLISPQMFFTLILRTISSFKVFETVRLLTNGGPNNATSTIVFQVYKEAMINIRIGYSSAMAVVTLVIVGILSAIYFLSLSKQVHYQ